MKKQHLPRGWTEKQIRELAERHDRQTQNEQAAEIDSAFDRAGQTLMMVPTELVPKILQLIRSKRPA